jgi:hypothetical protein
LFLMMSMFAVAHAEPLQGKITSTRYTWNDSPKRNLLKRWFECCFLQQFTVNHLRKSVMKKRHLTYPNTQKDLQKKPANQNLVFMALKFGEWHRRLLFFLDHSRA